MEIRPRAIREELMQLLTLVDASIDEVKKEARNRRILPQELRDTSGGWVMIPLLTAKAQILTCLVELNRGPNV
jgi:hypothetical protein